MERRRRQLASTPLLGFNIPSFFFFSDFLFIPLASSPLLLLLSLLPFASILLRQVIPLDSSSYLLISGHAALISGTSHPQGVGREHGVSIAASLSA